MNQTSACAMSDPAPPVSWSSLTLVEKAMVVGYLAYLVFEGFYPIFLVAIAALTFMVLR